MDKIANRRRLLRLAEQIEEESPIDGIHNREVEELFECAKALRDGLDEIVSGDEPTDEDIAKVVLEDDEPECERFMACTSEGTGESSYRSNPDFFVSDAEEMGEWLAGSYQEGWAANWLIDLNTGRGVAWKTTCTLLCAEVSIPTEQTEVEAAFGGERTGEGDEVSPVGEVPEPVQRRLGELQAHLDPDAKVTVARDWEGCLIGVVNGDSKLDALAFTEDGKIGHGGVNIPFYFPTVRDLLDAS